MFTKEELSLIYQALSVSSVQGSSARKVADLLEKVEREANTLKEDTVEEATLTETK